MTEEMTQRKEVVTISQNSLHLQGLDRDRKPRAQAHHEDNYKNREGQTCQGHQVPTEVEDHLDTCHLQT